MLRDLSCNQRLRFACAGYVLATAVLLVGCDGKRVTVTDTFPKSGYAAPWHLQDEVWSGTLEQATAGLGDEAQRWAVFEPERVWLAIYRHDTDSRRKLTARAWAFPSAAHARRAYEHFGPADANSLEAGDAGCWLPDGILVLWGRMVIDIFSSGTPAAGGAEQALYLLAFLEKQMPAGLPDAPR